MEFPTMRAVRYDGDGVRCTELRRVRPSTGEVLVRVTAVVVDRSDGEPMPGPTAVRLDRHGERILGRHVAGTVAAPGVGADGWPLGRQVALQPELATGRTRFVPGVEHDGGLADYVVVPAPALVAVPDLPPGTAALLPLAARAHAALVHCAVGPGAAVGIWGAGSLGGTAVPVARLLGAALVVVVDPSRQARDTALEHGADLALDPSDPGLREQLSTLTRGGGLDAVLHAASDASAAQQAVSALTPHGRAVLAGPAETVGGCDRWDARTLSGPPAVPVDTVDLLARLVRRERLHLPVPRELIGGLEAAAEVLDAAVRTGGPVAPCVVVP